MAALPLLSPFENVDQINLKLKVPIVLCHFSRLLLLSSLLSVMNLKNVSLAGDPDDKSGEKGRETKVPKSQKNIDCCEGRENERQHQQSNGEKKEV